MKEIFIFTIKYIIKYDIMQEVVIYMEKMSRVKKYRDLRESLNDDATLPKQDIKENEVEEDSFFIPTLKEYRQKQQTEKPVMFETSEILADEIDQESIENVEKAISKVRVTSGKGESYNTRLDILSQINSNSSKPKVEREKIVSNPGLKIDEDSGFELTSEFDFEPLSKEENESKKEVVQPKEEKKSKAKVQSLEVDEDDIEINEETQDEEEPGIMMKVLTGLIVVLSICLVCLVGYIVKLFLF